MAKTQKQYPGKLGVGEAFVYCSRLDASQMIKTTGSRTAKGIRRSVPDTEIAAQMTFWTRYGGLLKPYRECDLCTQCISGCYLSLRNRADYSSGKRNKDGRLQHSAQFAAAAKNRTGKRLRIYTQGNRCYCSQRK